MKIVINGRFLTIGNTGVRRVARHIVEHLDQGLARQPSAHTWIMRHPSAAAPLDDLKVIRSEPLPGLPGQLWEQATLAFASRSDLLVSLANTAPMMKVHRSIVMIHDAQVFDAPESYSPAFRLWYRFMQPRACRAATRVLSVSRHSAERLAAHGVVPDAAKVDVVYNGVDHVSGFDPVRGAIAAKGLGEKPYLLAFASTQPHKNTRLLLEIARSPQLAGFDMALIGSGLPEGQIVGGIARLLGRVTDGELRALYEGAFAFLLPSTTEGFGLPAGEAMLCGAPVVASSGGSLGEVWAGGARLAPPDAPQLWIDAILDLAASPERRDALRAAGRARAAGFTWQTAADQVRGIIEDVAAQAGARAAD